MTSAPPRVKPEFEFEIESPKLKGPTPYETSPPASPSLKGVSGTRGAGGGANKQAGAGAGGAAGVGSPPEPPLLSAMTPGGAPPPTRASAAAPPARSDGYIPLVDDSAEPGAAV